MGCIERVCCNCDTVWFPRLDKPEDLPSLNEEGEYDEYEQE